MEVDHKIDEKSQARFKLLSESVVYKRYLAVSDCLVEFPNGEQVKWDVVGHSFNQTGFFVCVFPFNSKTKTTTLIREYCQGVNSIRYGLPCGHFDPKHHKNFEEAARCELSEEAHIKSDKLIKLVPDEHPGIIEVKWCRNKMIPFLALDAEIDSQPLPKDKEEFIEIIPNVSIEEVKEIIYSGYMLLHSTQTFFMALNYLEKNGHLK